jgi:hypothetical protein
MDTEERSAIANEEDEKRRSDDVEKGRDNKSEPSATGMQPLHDAV